MDPALGPVYMLKANDSNGFYCIVLRPADAPKIGLIFAMDDRDKPLVATTQTVTMGWKNSSPLIYTATETVIDLANRALHAHAPLWPYNLDDRETTFFSAAAPMLYPTTDPLSRDPLTNPHQQPTLGVYECLCR